MTNDHVDSITTKISLVIGSLTATMTLAQMDLILSICLKSISIISFTIVIALNIDKLIEKIKQWIK